MKEVYIDTSVLGAYYCPEGLSQAAEAYLLKVEVPVISQLTEVEFSSLMAKKTRIGDFSRSKAGKILEEFRKHLDDGRYSRIALDTVDFIHARELIESFRSQLPTLDALHLALAARKELRVATADRILEAAARKFHVRVDLIRG